VSEIYEIADINFGRKNIKDLTLLKKMAGFKADYGANNDKLKKREKMKSKEIDKLE
jgi:hypothetical protein